MPRRVRHTLNSRLEVFAILIDLNDSWIEPRIGSLARIEITHRSDRVGQRINHMKMMPS